MVPGSLGKLFLVHNNKVSNELIYFVIGLKAALGFFGSASRGGEFANQGANFALSMIETSIGK